MDASVCWEEEEEEEEGGAVTALTLGPKSAFILILWKTYEKEKLTFFMSTGSIFVSKLDP